MEPISKITNERKDEAIEFCILYLFFSHQAMQWKDYKTLENQKCLLIWLQVQIGFGPIALSSQFPVFSTSIWPLLPNLLSCFEIWKPFLCQLIDVVLHRKVCSQSRIFKVLRWAVLYTDASKSFPQAYFTR